MRARARTGPAGTGHADRLHSLGELAGGIAHDFNNLLSGILSSSEFLLEDAGPGDPIRPDVEAIRKTAQRAIGLTRRLLAFSHRESVSPELLDLGGLVRGLEELLRRSLGDELTLVVEVAQGLRQVQADPGQLEHVIVNLAINARDAMPDGGTLRVAVDATQIGPERGEGLEPGRYVRLRVSDTGVGIDPELLPLVFEPFFTTKPEGAGTGLGLAMADAAVREAGGSITVRSVQGEGSVFTVLLPAQAAAGTGRVPRHA
jgi:signal transduction histidine kinase